MTLGDLLAGLVTPALLSAPPITTTPSAPVTAVTYDSRRVTPGTVFVALRGLKADGARFALQAVARGAWRWLPKPKRAARARCRG
jgi:UDP-N-acetylmuramoyl-L-alanyl-D-glutamate--2,6-diaminopimelate ligase